MRSSGTPTSSIMQGRTRGSVSRLRETGTSRSIRVDTAAACVRAECARRLHGYHDTPHHILVVPAFSGCYGGGPGSRRIFGSFGPRFEVSAYGGSDNPRSSSGNGSTPTEARHPARRLSSSAISPWPELGSSFPFWHLPADQLTLGFDQSG